MKKQSLFTLIILFSVLFSCRKEIEPIQQSITSSSENDARVPGGDTVTWFHYVNNPDTASDFRDGMTNCNGTDFWVDVENAYWKEFTFVIVGKSARITFTTARLFINNDPHNEGAVPAAVINSPIGDTIRFVAATPKYLWYDYIQHLFYFGLYMTTKGPAGATYKIKLASVKIFARKDKQFILCPNYGIPYFGKLMTIRNR